MIIHALQEGLYSVDQTKKFIPFDEGKDKLADRKPGSFLLGVQPFLVQTREGLVLLDTGLGLQYENDLLLEKLIREKGFLPEDVSMVLMSHLHKDHIGGMLKYNLDHEVMPTFPNATYHIQKREFDYAMNANTPSFDTKTLAAIAQLPNLNWMDQDQGQLNASIRFEVTGGHSPFHQAFRIEEDGEIGFYGADVAPMLFQLQNKINAKYDFDGKKAMEYRERWLQEGTTQHWQFMFYHDVKTQIWQA